MLFLGWELIAGISERFIEFEIRESQFRRWGENVSKRRLSYEQKNEGKDVWEKGAQGQSFRH